MEVYPVPLDVPSASNAKTAAANTAVVVTFTGISNYRHLLSWLCWSYDADPTGTITIALDGVTVMKFSITKGGPGALPLPDLPGTLGGTFVVTLSAGGVGIVGFLNVYARREPVSTSGIPSSAS